MVQARWQPNEQAVLWRGGRSCCAILTTFVSASSGHCPTPIVQHVRKVHPADDDGLWFIRLPSMTTTIQLESSTGACPFLVETDEQSSFHARTAHTVHEAIQLVVEYLQAQHGR